jgi:hypothetical protein
LLQTVQCIITTKESHEYDSHKLSPAIKTQGLQLLTSGVCLIVRKPRFNANEKTFPRLSRQVGTPRHNSRKLHVPESPVDHEHTSIGTSAVKMDPYQHGSTSCVGWTWNFTTDTNHRNSDGVVVVPCN